MPQKQKNIPVLRFPGFNGGWSRKKIGDVAPLQRGFDLLTSEVIKGEFPVVYSNGILRTHNQYQAKAPGVVTGRSGTIGKVTYVENDYWPHNTSLWVTDFKGNYPKYIYYMYYQVKLEKYNAGSTVPTLNRNDVHVQKIYIPEPREQEKIAEFLGAVDEKIASLQKKKGLLESYKNGCMQKLFSQEIRFTDDNNNLFSDWKNKTIGDLGRIVGGGTPDTMEKTYWGGSIQWFTPTELKQKYVSESVRTITESGLRNSSAKLLPVGTILLSTRATVGDVSIALKECCTNQGFQSLVTNIKNYNEFCYYLLQTQKRQIIRKSSGSTFLEISKSEIEKIKVSVPHLDEQKKIADFLSAIDNKIALVFEELDQAKTFKRGLLQKMFV